MFSSKDLATFLPGDASSSSLRYPDSKDGGVAKSKFVPLKEKEGAAKVTRYYANKAPTWFSQKDASSISSSNSVDVKNEVKNEVKSGGADGRLARLGQSRAAVAISGSSNSASSINNNINSNSNSVDAAPLQRRRRTYEAQVIVDSEASSKPSDSNNVLPMERSKEDYRIKDERATVLDFSRGNQRRSQGSSGGDDNIKSEENSRRDEGANMSRRERALARRKLESESESSESSEEEEDDEEDEEDDEDDEDFHIKPIFVPKHMRQSTLHKEALEKEEESRLKRLANEANSRIQNTREMLAESIRRNEKEDSHSLLDIDDSGIPNGEDLTDDEEEVSK